LEKNLLKHKKDSLSVAKKQKKRKMGSALAKAGEPSGSTRKTKRVAEGGRGPRRPWSGLAIAP